MKVFGQKLFLGIALLSTIAESARTPYNERECSSLGGECLHVSRGCSEGTFLNRKCPTQPRSVKCCRPDLDYDKSWVDEHYSGASAATARQDGLKITGPAASTAMVERDLKDLLRFERSFVEAGKKYGIPKEILMGIASRESRAGRILDKNGWGDHGNAFGLMQVDKRYHKIPSTSTIDNVDQGADILKGMIEGVTKEHPDWTKNQQLRGGVAAYNFGISNVRTIARMDIGTTGNDYSSDVMARAQHLAKRHI